MFLENQLPRTSAGFKGRMDISPSTRKEISERGEISRACQRIFRARSIDGKPGAYDVTVRNGEDRDIYRASVEEKQRESKESIVVVRSKMSGASGTTSTSGQLLARCNEYGARVSLVCNSTVITLSHDCTGDSIETPRGRLKEQTNRGKSDFFYG